MKADMNSVRDSVRVVFRFAQNEKTEFVKSLSLSLCFLVAGTAKISNFKLLRDLAKVVDFLRNHTYK